MMDLKNDSSVSISFIQNNYKENGLKFLPLVYQVVDLNSNTLVSDHDSPEIIFGVENSSRLVCYLSPFRGCLQAAEARPISDPSEEEAKRYKTDKEVRQGR